MSPTTEPLQDHRFLLLGRLGRGGMGSVYRAFDRLHERLVALKVARGTMRAGPAHPLSAEFDVWSRIAHPNIVRAYELMISRSGPFPRQTPYLVLEHVDPRATDDGPLPPDHVRTIAVQLLDALGHLHASGWVHRDLKPSNVLFDSTAAGGSRAVLTDFGLAVRTGATDEPGMLSGSLHYVAPESLLGQAVDGRADLYALGLLLYRLATGRRPTPAQDLSGVLRWHLGGPPADPCRIRPGFPKRLARFIRRLTAREREQRPRTAAEALSLLGARVGTTRAVVVDRSMLAAVRLALDATRIGDRRAYFLPSCAVSSRSLVDEVRVWSQVHGLVYCSIVEDATDAGRALSGLVLRLTGELGRDAREAARRLRLQHHLPLDFICGNPLRDLAAPGKPGGSGVAQRVTRFILYCAARRALVLHLHGGPGADPLWHDLLNELLRTMRQPGGPGAGGLLLLIEGRQVAHPERMTLEAPVINRG